MILIVCANSFSKYTLLISKISTLSNIKIIFNLKFWIIFFIMGSLNNVIPFLGITYAQESIPPSLASLFKEL
jgi:hypothetical protein